MAVLAVFLAVVVGTVGPVEAAKKKETAKPALPHELPMTVVIVRSGEPGCEPICPEWIAAEGEITAASPRLFRKALKQAGRHRLPVVIHSPGGRMDAAIEIGRMIRARKLDVAVGWTLYDGCRPADKACKLPKAQKGIYRGMAYPGRAVCNSACPMVLAAGQRRLASPWSFVGVHQVRTTWVKERVTYREKYLIVNGRKKVVSRTIVSRKPVKSYEKLGLDKRLRETLTAYLNEMGISLALLDDMEMAPPTSIHELSLARMDELKLLTDHATVMQLTSKTVCLAAAPAEHCVPDGPAKAGP